MWVNLPGQSSPSFAVFDGGAEVAVLSTRVFEQLSPTPDLQPTRHSLKGLYGPSRQPRGECILKIYIPELKLTAEYVVVVDDIDEDLILDAGFMHHTNMSLDYKTKTLHRGSKVAKTVGSLRRADAKVYRLSVQEDWVVPPRCRQLVPARINRDGRTTTVRDWIVEPSRLMGQRHSVLVCKTLCQDDQLRSTIPTEVYNPTDEPVHLNRDTTLGVVSPAEMVTECDFSTVDASSEKEHVKPELPAELQLLVDQTESVLDHNQRDKFRALLVEFQDIFSTAQEPLGCTDNVTHDIKTTGKPVKVGYRRIPPGLRDEAIKEEERMKELGVIEPSESPWAAPVVLVRKKDGSLRYCIDYRRLNDVTIKDSYPLPNMQDCLESLEGAKFFSSMDLSSGYWQVQLSEDAKEKTAFYGAGGGLWQFKAMPFGLCNAPATFERLMERVLGQLQWHICLCYLDDILVYSRSVNKHLEDLRAIFLKLREANLKLKPKKCHFFRKQVSFLGHIVNSEGIHTDPAKVEKIKNCSSPRNIHELRSVMGMFSYYRRFINHFSELAKPLITLTEGNKNFHWGPEQDKAFLALKEALMKAPVLAHPRIDGDFILDTDASNVGIGGVLSQVQDGVERVISFGSRILTKAERNYCTTRREMLAVVHFCEQYKHFLLGRPFQVRTDNAAVRYWTKLSASTYEPKGQVARWIIRLGSFDFNISHRAGKDHGNADAMSREPFSCAQCDIVHHEAKKFKRKNEEEDVSSKAVFICNCACKHSQHVNDVSKPVEDTTCSAISTDSSPPISSTTSLMNHKEKRIPHMKKLRRHQDVTNRRTDRSNSLSTKDSSADNKSGFNSTSDSVVPDQRSWVPLHVGELLRGRYVSPASSDTMNGGSSLAAVTQSNKKSKISPKEKEVAKEVHARVLTRQQMSMKDGPSRSLAWLGECKLGRATILAEQRSDPAVVDAICWIQQDKPDREDIMSLSAEHKYLWANYDVLKLVDGVLCRVVGPLNDGSLQTTVYVPPSLRKEVMQICHDNKTAGHFYYWKTLHAVKKRFCWAGMSKDIQLYCQACHTCATKKNAGKKYRAAMRRYDTGYPMEEISIDLMGPFPVSSQGNKYVLVVVDSFSKWMEAYAIPSIHAEVVAEKLLTEFMSRFGVPHQIKSDRGKQFDCELFNHLCRLLEVDHFMSTPFHPQGNSKCERMVKVVGNLISAFCSDYENWDHHLSLLTMAYRTTVHEVTGYTPNLIMTGREISLPVDIMLGDLQQQDKVTACEYIERVQKRLTTCFDAVRKHLKEYGQRQQKHYNLNTKGKEFTAGDLVYLRETTRKKSVCPKLQPKWKGPYLILKKFGSTYEVLLSSNKSKTYHFDLLKPCRSTEMPKWMKKHHKKISSSMKENDPGEKSRLMHNKKTRSRTSK